jgi:hypothetical protein
LRVVEGVGVDQWLVDAGEGLLAPVNPPDIRLVAENPENDGWLPAARRCGRLFAVESAGDGGGAESPCGVPLEDAPDDGRPNLHFSMLTDRQFSMRIDN